MPDNCYSEREKLVIDLYKDQNKSIREIAKTAKMSFLDIGLILKKHGLNHGIAVEDDDNNKKSHSNNEKCTQAYKLFSEGKSLLQVSIELGLIQKEASKLFMEFLKLKRLDRLYQIYPAIEPYLASFLKLHTALKKRGLNSQNIDWYANAIETGAVKLPELQAQHQKLQNEIKGMQYRKQELEREAKS